jgi:hypothetical protein
MRSTRGIMMDMYRRSEKVIEVCDRYAGIVVKETFLPISGSPIVFIPLHKGADRFMSPEQFETSHWPLLNKLMLGLYIDGYIPAPFAEGRHNHDLGRVVQPLKRQRGIPGSA